MMAGTAGLRVAVVGVGHLGRHHARLLSVMTGVELVGIVDIEQERARAVACEFGTGVIADKSELCTKVDAAVVAVPTVAHVQVVSPLLEAGVSVLVEKPMASSSDEAEKLIQLAEKSRSTLAVGHTERHNPAVTAALPFITKPRFMEVHRLATFQPRSLDIDVVFDVMIHDIDVVLSIIGSEPVSLEAVGVPVLSNRIDIANARLRFKTGCIVNLTASRVSRERVRKLRVFQPHSLISVDYEEQHVESWKVTRNADGQPVINGGSIAVQNAEPLERELLDFVEAVNLGRAAGVTAVDGHRALVVAEAIVEAMQVAPPIAEENGGT